MKEIRSIIRKIIKETVWGPNINDYPDFFDPLYNKSFKKYPAKVAINPISEMDAPNKELEENKPYKYFMLCDELCRTSGVHVKNKMIEDSKPVSAEEFLDNCAYSKSLLVYEDINETSDPSMGFYKSNVDGIPCYYVQFAGFEYIFIKGYPGGKEYWLDEMWDEDGEFIY